MATQLGLFDGENEFHLLDKPIRLISLFSGYDSQALALKYLGVPFEHYKTCEWAIPSILALYDLHFNDNHKKSENNDLCSFYAQKISKDYSNPLNYKQVCKLGKEKLREIDEAVINSNNLLNITNIHGKDLEIVDTKHYNYILTYSFPCFTADSLVLTSEGYKHINEVKVGDYVLTHTNTYQRVSNVYDNGLKPIWKLKTMGADEIKLTPLHKLYVRKMRRVKGKRVFEEPEWKETHKIVDGSYYVGTAINQNSIIPSWDGIDFIWTDGRKTRHSNILGDLMNNQDWWYIVGRYIADGWQRKEGGVIICTNPNKIDPLLKALDNCELYYTVVKERTTDKVHICYKEVGAFLKEFGDRAINKHLTNKILDLPIDLLESFLNGYWYADGCADGKKRKATTISRELAYGLGECIAKVYNRPYSIYFTTRPETAVIENRTIHQHNTYEISYKTQTGTQDKAFYENGYIWSPIQNFDIIGKEEVYDLEVENDHSFTVQNVIVHNCQDLSLSGSRKGMSEGSGTRSSLLWEVGRLLDECKELPQFLLMENVPQVLERNNIKEFGKWIDRLESKGYKCYYKVLNAKDYGVPQNRARCYMVSILGDYKYYFPESTNEPVKLLDVLEKEVDEKYFISKDTLHTSLTTPYWSATLGERLPRDEDGLAHTLKADATNEVVADLVAFDKDGNLYDSTEDKDNLIGQFENHRKWHKKKEAEKLIDTDNLEETKTEFNVWSKDGKAHSTRKLDEHGLIEFGENYCTIPNSKGNINAQNNRFYKVDCPNPNLQTRNTPQVIIDEPTAFTKRKENPNQEKLPIEVNEEQKGIVLHTGNKVLNETATKIDINDKDVQYLDCYDRAIKKDISCTIKTRIDASNEDYIYQNYRIRKLTPRECYRLMGVRDEDYDKIAPRQSEKSLYHMAGDSIVVNVLMAIFKEAL